MIYFQKSLTILFLYFALIPLLIVSCDKEEDGPDQTPALHFVESSLPDGDLAAEGGSITIDVAWAYTQWEIRPDTVLEGREFITEVTPFISGSPRSAGETGVTLTFSRNDSYEKNQQQLTLSSLDGTLVQTVTLTQAGKTAEPTPIGIDPGKSYQTVAGFGGANVMWGTRFLSPSEIRSAFGTEETGLGLSILRVRISPHQNEWSPLREMLKETQQYSVKIIASPWSPPAHMKSNGDLTGGELLEEYYADYADHLNSFVEYMASGGVDIHAVSIQNEPDIQVSYESCDWSPQQMLHFIRNYAPAIEGTRIAAAESFNFNQSYTDVLLLDTEAEDNFDIVAGHIYGGGLAPYPLAEEKGKEIWMTEYLMNMNENWVRAEDRIWEESMQMLRSIQRSMLLNWNTYIWWYIKRYYSFLGDGAEGTTEGAVLKRGHAIAQFSKFIRPGYVRIDAQAEGATPLEISAYTGDNKVVVVLINPTAEPVMAVNISVPQSITSAVAYTTSLAAEREEESLSPEEGVVAINMAPKSITTLLLDF